MLDCPTCRKNVHLNKEKLDGLPRNLALENIVLRYSEEKRRYALSVNYSVQCMYYSVQCMYYSVRVCSLSILVRVRLCLLRRDG